MFIEFAKEMGEQCKYCFVIGYRDQSKTFRGGSSPGVFDENFLVW